MTFNRITFEQYSALTDKKKLIYDYEASVEEMILNKLGKELGSQYILEKNTKNNENDDRTLPIVKSHPFVDDINNIEYLKKIYNYKETEPSF